MEPENAYSSRLADLRRQIDRARSQLSMLAWIRLCCFVLAAVCVYCFITTGFEWVWGLLALLPAAGFVYALARYQQVKDHLQLQQTLEELNEKELHLLSTYESRFEDGSEFIDEQHPFSSDLDVFGPASLYQHMNRTGTLMGRKELARLLQSPLQLPQDILDMQAAVEELAPRMDFRQLLTAQAILARETPGDRVSLRNWLEMPLTFIHNRWLRVLSWLSPACLFISLINYAVTNNHYPAVFFLIVNWTILLTQVKKVQEQHTQIGSKQRILHRFARLLNLIRKEPFKDVTLLREQQQQAVIADHALYRLARISSALDQRLNMVVGFFLNTLALYDLHCMFSLEKWKSAYGQQVDGWFGVIARMEAWSSLATFAFNHPRYIFPQVNGQEMALETSAIGHPLIPPADCVANDISIGRPQHFLIITGSNMSGKSTFLRSVGSNLLLGMCGAPVCAGTFSFTPMHIMTSMRIKDSIAKHTSYFQAELLRLQQIVEELQRGRQVFILLDEILKGTNSEDKLAGSRRLTEHFLQYKCLGLIATHDLELGNLENTYPGSIRNYCFESTIREDHLYFDYLIREGIARNKNATFLMKQMGIIRE